MSREESLSSRVPSGTSSKGSLGWSRQPGANFGMESVFITGAGMIQLAFVVRLGRSVVDGVELCPKNLAFPNERIDDLVLLCA